MRRRVWVSRRGRASRWVKAAKNEAADAFRGQGQRTAEQQELFELRQRVRQFEEERAILKKAAAYFAKLSG